MMLVTPVALLRQTKLCTNLINQNHHNFKYILCVTIFVHIDVINQELDYLKKDEDTILKLILAKIDISKATAKDISSAFENLSVIYKTNTTHSNCEQYQL